LWERRRKRRGERCVNLLLRRGEGASSRGKSNKDKKRCKCLSDQKIITEGKENAFSDLAWRRGSRLFQFERNLNKEKEKLG